jgi:hypothetical protein
MTSASVIEGERYQKSHAPAGLVACSRHVQRKPITRALQRVPKAELLRVRTEHTGVREHRESWTRGEAVYRDCGAFLYLPHDSHAIGRCEHDVGQSTHNAQYCAQRYWGDRGSNECTDTLDGVQSDDQPFFQRLHFGLWWR